MKWICILLFIYVCDQSAWSQNGTKINGLLKMVHFQKEDTNKVKMLLKIEESYLYNNDDSALYYNYQCESLISRIGAQKFKHQCFHDFVKIFHSKGNFKKALEYCQKSLEVAKQNKNKFQESTSYRAIFNIYHNLHMNDSAVRCAVYSIQLTTEINDTSNLAVNCGNLCWLYLDLSQLKTAIKYGQMGVEAGEKYKDTVGLLVSLNNLATCYLKTNVDVKAIPLLKKQYEIGCLVNRNRSVRNALYNLGTIYFYKGDTAALEKTTILLSDFNKKNRSIDIKNKTFQYIIYGFNYFLHKKFKLAEEQLLIGMKLAEADSIIKPLLIFYSTYSDVKYAQNDIVTGNYYEEKWDSTFQKTKEKELSEFEEELQTRYEVEKKSTKIKLQEAKLREKTILNYVVIGAGLTLLIISLLTYRTYKQKNKLQVQRINELETLHHLSVTKAVLKGEEQERTRLAKDLHDGLGGMLSGIKYSFINMKENLIMTPDNQQAFERSLDMLDSSMKEMRRVAHNMMPEALVRFGLNSALTDFCNDISQSSGLKVNYQSFGMEGVSIDQTVSITIYRIVQELLNNTMKHSGANNAIVQLTKSDGQLSVTVEDNGKGFDTKILTESKGIGWINIQNRVDFLKGKLNVTSKVGEGTSVLIELNS